MFSLTFYGVDGHRWVEELLTSLPGGQVGFLIFVNVIVFLLAFFLDFFELAFIIVPLLARPGREARHRPDLVRRDPRREHADELHASAVWFALFYLRSVAPREPYIDRITGKRMEPVTTGQIYWGAVPFVVIQCIMVGLVIAFPQMVMHYKGTGTGVDPAKVRFRICPSSTCRRSICGPPKIQYVPKAKRPGARPGRLAYPIVEDQLRGRERTMKLS